jgi:DNA-binding transcriptional regulator YdaS (Cro superfamily)
MKVDQAVKYYKTQKKLAKVLNITESSVSQWKARGGIIPIKIALRLTAMTKGKIPLRLEDY